MKKDYHMTVNEIGTIEELEKLADENNRVLLYGAGKLCDKILCYLELKKKISSVKGILVTQMSQMPIVKHGIEITEFESDESDSDIPLVVTVLSPVFRKEILDLLATKGRDCYVVSGKSFDRTLDIALRSVKYPKIKQTLQEYAESMEGQGVREDIRFFTPPYWDIYSPFSAVPCLVARLQQDGYKVGQVDLGILCIHWMIKHRWKEAAALCTSLRFYDCNIKNYRKNPYDSYDDFLSDMWFFENDIFDVNLVKDRYMEMNFVQKRVIDAFYQTLYSLDVVDFDFDRCQDLIDDVDNYILADFLDEITSEEIITVFHDLPKIIGISVTSTGQFLPACLFAKIVKEIWPDTTIMMGGSCADLLIKSQYKKKDDICQFFDYVMVGEGETSISMLMNHLTKGQNIYNEIPNLLHFDEIGNPVIVEQIVEDVDTLLPANYDGLDLDQYLSPKPILPYQSSRGCHYGHCAFCNHDEKYRHNYRTKDMKRVVEELIYLSKKYNVNNFQFVDEAIRPDCFRQMIDEMDKHEEFKNIYWFFYSRVSYQYDQELLEKAVRNGCKMVMFGVESFNQRLLNFIRKGINAETSKYCLKLFHDCGIKTYAWLMCNLPSETIKEAKEDLECVREMERYIDAFAVGPFYLSRNTDMYDDPEKFNITFIDEADPCRFMSHNEGELIDKDAMLTFFEQDYMKYQLDYFSTGNRYTLYFEETE